MKYIYSETDIFNCTISIDDLIRIIDSNKSHYNGSWFISFIEKWKKAIFNCYQREANRIYHLENLDLFKESIFINGREFRFHFNILKAKKYSLQLQRQQLPLDSFSERFDSSSKAVIKYTHPNMINVTYDYKLCQIPIIVVHFFHQGSFYLVIDGNHRVAAKKEANLGHINGILLRPQDTVDILSSEFEIAMYLFLYENFLLSLDDFSIVNRSNANRFI